MESSRKVFFDGLVWLLHDIFINVADKVTIAHTTREFCCTCTCNPDQDEVSVPAKSLSAHESMHSLSAVSPSFARTWLIFQELRVFMEMLTIGAQRNGCLSKSLTKPLGKFFRY